MNKISKQLISIANIINSSDNTFNDICKQAYDIIDQNCEYIREQKQMKKYYVTGTDRNRNFDQGRLVYDINIELIGNLTQVKITAILEDYKATTQNELAIQEFNNVESQNIGYTLIDMIRYKFDVIKNTAQKESLNKLRSMGYGRLHVIR